MNKKTKNLTEVLVKEKKHNREYNFLIFYAFIVISFMVLFTFDWRYDFNFSNIVNIKIWQYLLAIFGGGSLAVAGLLLQKLTKNNLSDVSLLGIGSINIVFITIYIWLMHDGTNDGNIEIRKFLPLIGISSSILGTSIIYSLIKIKNSKSSQFIIIGIAIQFLFEAISVTLINPKFGIYQDNGNKNAFIIQEIQNFTLGRFPNIYLLSQTWSWKIWNIFFFVTISIIMMVIYYLREQIDLISINDDIAYCYGINVRRIKFLMFIMIALLAGIEASMIGTISLLGILAPSFSRMIFGDKIKLTLFSSFFIGAILVLIAAFIDVNLNFQVPIGLLSTAIAIPCFIYLVFKK